ncbi:MAG: RluA family pseudouridine synthase [Fusobacteriaceae bacterium]
MKYVVDEKYSGARVDRVLRNILCNTPLSEIFKGIRTGKIKLNDKKTKENSRVELGDTFEIDSSLVSNFQDKYYQDNNSSEKKIELTNAEILRIKNSIIYEDDKVLIINKESGLVMHKGSNHEYGLTEMLKQILDSEDFTFVNRIDKNTSGLVIGAKTLPVARELSEELRENNIIKKYYILVEGKVLRENFKIKSYLKKIETGVVELDSYDKDAKECVSYFKVLQKVAGDKTLLVGELGSGRTHQLRVQLSNIGHPIVGDIKYGAKKNAKRMMLHSFYLEIQKYNLKFELPLPADFMV